MPLKRININVIAVGKTKGRPTYYVQYREPLTGKLVRRSTKQKTQRETEDWIEANLLDQGVTPESKIRLREYLPEALEAHFRESEANRGRPVSLVHQKNQKSYLRRFIMSDKISGTVLGDVRRGDLDDFKVRLVERLREQRPTVNRVLKLIKLLMKRAEQRGDIDRDPGRGIKPVAAEERTRSPFTDIELHKLFPTKDPWSCDDFSPWSGYQPYVAGLLAATTGMRRGEIAALTWESVSLETDPPQVLVKDAVKDNTTIGRPKNNKTRRTPIFSRWMFGDDRAVLALRELKKRATKSSNVVSVVGEPEAVGLVFPTQGGSRYRLEWINDELLDAMLKAGINRSRENGELDLTLHSLRHTLESRLHAQGLPDTLIRAYLGHADARMQERYTHHDTDNLRRAAETYGFETTKGAKETAR